MTGKSNNVTVVILCFLKLQLAVQCELSDYVQVIVANFIQCSIQRNYWRKKISMLDSIQKYMVQCSIGYQ